MKAELVDVNETRKNLTIEIPRDVVDAEIERVARDYSRKARIPGFRPGKAPAGKVDEAHFISALDFTPTVLEAVGLEPQSRLDGRSFLPLLEALLRWPPARARSPIAKRPRRRICVCSSYCAPLVGTVDPSPRYVENCIEHRLGQAAGERILLAGVVAA